VTPRRSDLDAVTFDAMGTILTLVDPVPRLQRALRHHHGVEVSLDRCHVAMQAEIRHYRAISHRASTREALAAVRLECAGVLASALQVGLDAGALLPCLTDAIAFEAYPDTAGVMERLRASGLAIGVVSNWDVSLHDVLARLGLAPLVDAVVTSAEAGSSKPDAAIFERAGELLDARPHRMLHVGDDAEGDVDGARAAHLHAVHLVREGTLATRRPRIATLLELPALLDLDHAA
jgi:putative hydrolase of the HAD superfamily